MVARGLPRGHAPETKIDEKRLRCGRRTWISKVRLTLVRGEALRTRLGCAWVTNGYRSFEVQTIRFSKRDTLQVREWETPLISFRSENQSAESRRLAGA